MHILVTGAGGYIGAQVAILLRKNGHTVYGLARKDEDLKRLARHEVIPVKGDQSDIKSIPNEILDKVTTVIDTVMVFTDNPPLATNRALIAAVREVTKRTGTKRRYIYTSGCLVYGDYGTQVVDETFQTKSPLPRVAFEKEVIAFQDIEGVVIRPTWVYGGPGNKYIDFLWRGNANGDIEVRGNPNKTWSWVHVFDLAHAYVIVTEAPSGAVQGQIFDVSDDTRMTAEQVQVLMARTAGVKGKVVHVPALTDFFAQLCEASIIIKADKIRRLGWRPRAGPLSDAVAIAYAAQEAHK